MKTLYDWQKPHRDVLLNALNEHGVALDSSDTGVGKTVIAMDIANDLGLEPFVLCPKSVIPSWNEHGAEFTLNYEKLRAGNTEFVKKEGNRFSWYLDPSKVIMIFDEVHRCKGEKSLQSKLLAAAKRQGYKILMLSATAFHTPVEMKSIGFALDLHDYKGWWMWCISKCGCRRGTFGGLSFRGGQTILSKIHNYIYEEGTPRGSRIKINDLPDGSFPDTLITADGYQIDDSEALDKIYEEMRLELKEFEEKTADDDDSPLVIMLRARQKVELMKVPLFEDLVKDYINSGNSVVVFLNFKDSLTALGNRLSGSYGISVVEGGQSSEVRDRHVKDFQSNKTSVMLCMTQAGGTGLSLHDTDGNFPRVSLISPSFSAVDLRQALGRVHRASGASSSIQKIVFACDTIEMGVCRSIRTKLNSLDLINDNELNPII